MAMDKQKWSFVMRLVWWAVSLLYNHLNSKRYGKD